MEAMDVGKKLVEMCKAGEHRKAIEELYADEVDVIEPMPMPGQANGVTSRADILAASDHFMNVMEVHGGDVQGPYPMDDKFIVFMSLDATPKEGPMAGHRMDMCEACVYGVKDGKIVSSRFCYDVPEGGY